MDNLFAGIWSSPDEKTQSTVKLSRAGRFRWGKPGNLPGWQLCRGISGSFRVEWVAGFVWNQWQPWSGIRRLREYLEKICRLIPHFQGHPTLLSLK
ncbi:hypothetical protein MELB17_12616 [Marinobacter sp. ELB17]|nr:hypothetical protein MELB17_12616 [Marinobacter sp. ELB17]